jgi:hypothetical protein
MVQWDVSQHGEERDRMRKEEEAAKATASEVAAAAFTDANEITSFFSMLPFLQGYSSPDNLIEAHVFASGFLI